MEEMTGRSDGEARRGTPKGFRRGIGKLFLVVAGMGAVAVLMLVVMPMLTAPVPEPPPLAPEAIVAEVLSEPAREGQLDPAEDVAPLELPAVPTPLVAVKRNGEEISVVFPAAREAGASEEVQPEAALPPLLSPEEIDAAVVVPVSEEAPPVEVAPAPIVASQVDTETPPGLDTGQSPVPSRQSPGNSQRTVIQALGGMHPLEMTLPPSGATREVQELLVSLGYDPGPVDGIWGDRTERAWKRFATDTSDLESGVELAEALPQAPGTAAVTPYPEDSAPPSGGTGVEAGSGPRQAGSPQASLPPDTALPEGKRMRVPGTLRSVMGYRLPLVSRQEVPDQVVSGVLIPAHTTFVILRGGEWELTGLEAHEVGRMRDADEVTAAPGCEPQSRKRCWSPLRLFKRQPASADGE